MRKYFIIAAVLVVCAAIGAGIFIAQNPKALNVYEVGSDPAAYAGTITVVGVIRAVSTQDPTIFGIMDMKELQCKQVNCNKPLLPVKFQGPLPAVGAEVRVTGSFITNPNGYLFVAESIKVVRQHQIGG